VTVSREGPAARWGCAFMEEDWERRRWSLSATAIAEGVCWGVPSGLKKEDENQSLGLAMMLECGS
jgi:hypothetical protein